MRDKSLEKKTFWIYSTNKFVWIGVVICSIFSAFMIYFLCVALSENKVLLIFLLPISLSILLIYWALPSKILLGEDKIEERGLFKKRSIRVDEINSWGVLQMYKPYRCKEGIYSYIPAKSFKPSRKIEENMNFSYSLFLSNIPHYDGKKKHSSQTDKTIFVSYRKEVYMALEKHLKKILYLLVLPLMSMACSPKAKLSSAGMYPNYQVGEMVRLVPVDSLTYGDVIAYHAYIPGFQERAFKRIVGLPGDTIRFQDQQCIVNGKKNEWVFIRKLFYEEDECEVYCERLPNGMKVNICKSVVPIDPATATTTAVVVPADSYFVAGDYRGGSIDSRSLGCVAADSIIGKGVKTK